MSMDHMKQALKNRRGRGLDVSIIIGKPEHEEGKTDLAPPSEGDASAEHPLAEMHDKLSEHEKMESPEDELGDEDLMSGMNEHDLSHLKEPGNAKSLGQKARLAAMMRMKK
jgi:hypothetical protein